MNKRILVVDDSALMRRVLSDVITSDSRFYVADVACNGMEALELMVREQRNYDAVILDMNMPKMDGLTFLRELETQRIHTKVIIVSTIAIEGAVETIQALELGAFDFVTKPERFYELKSDQFRNRLIQSLCAALTMEYEQDITMAIPVIQSPMPVQDPVRVYTATANQKIVAIACSTGGPKALQSIIPLLPANLDASVLIVQHMPSGFTKSLAQRLNEKSALEVKEAEDGEELKKGVVYIAAGGRHFRIAARTEGGHRIRLSDEAPRMGLRPCADVMFESLVSCKYERITSIVLTGMGADATNGIRLLKGKKEVYVIAQDEATSTVYGMPKSIANAGVVNEIVPLDRIADAITKNVGVK